MSAVSAFADDLLWDMLALSPDLAAELGLSQVNGRALPADGLIDFSDATAARRRALMDARAAALTGLDPGATDAQDRTTLKVLRYLLDEGAFGPFAGRAGGAFPEVPYPVNHLSGWHPSMLMMLTRDHGVATAQDAQAYLDRMAAIPGAVDAVVEALAAREAQGMVAPRSTLTKALAVLEDFVAGPAADNLLVRTLRDKARGPLGAAAADRLAGRAETLVAGAIRPAYARLINAVLGQLARVGEDAGYWRLPDGEAWYAWLLRSHTTTDLTPEAVHAIGLEEIARVQSQIRAEFRALGVEGGSIGDLYATISGPAHQAFGPGTVDRDVALARTTDLIETLAERAAPLFDRLPRAGVEVALIAPEAEANQHSHYTPPSGSGRSGRFSLNVRATQGQPGWELPVLCAHEATPGHHLQLALAQELPLCAFRRTVVFTAYIEGWAKYAETLLDHDLMDDPHVRLGRLRGELYSSVNLALDTGVHARRWTRGQAARFFREQTGVGSEFADAIVDRSLVWPGQMTAYKVGLLKMRTLRDRMAVRPGEAGGRKAFHSAVLEQGALPLAILDDLSQDPAP